MSGCEPGARLDAILERTLDCVHCGLCLPVCPTYRETGRETSSPRGRIHLMRAFAEGRIELDEVVVDEAYFCLGCRACETACPSGVRYGALLETLREEIERTGRRAGFAKRVESFALREIIPHPRRIRRVIDGLALAQACGLIALARRFAPRRVRALVAQAPRVPPRRDRRPLPAFTPARGARRGRVAMFRGCVMPELFGDVAQATVRVLVENGFDVLVPDAQGCCGALHAHAGDLESARRLARRNLEAFDLGAIDAVIVDSAGCGAALRELGQWLPGEGERLAAAVRDVCEWLDEAGLRAPAVRVERSVCYDDPCHLVHAQRVHEAPRRLLSSLPGLRLLPHDDPTSCCGAAGIYSLTHPESSRAVLARKMAAFEAVDPDVIATGNPGCLMQLRNGVAEKGMRARVLHPVQLLAEGYSG